MSAPGPIDFDKVYKDEWKAVEEKRTNEVCAVQAAELLDDFAVGSQLPSDSAQPLSEALLGLFIDEKRLYMPFLQSSRNKFPDDFRRQLGAMWKAVWPLCFDKNKKEGAKWHHDLFAQAHITCLALTVFMDHFFNHPDADPKAKLAELGAWGEYLAKQCGEDAQRAEVEKQMQKILGILSPLSS